MDVDEPMFQPFPSELYFQNFKAGETIDVPLTLRNNDKVPRLVRVIQADTPYFKLIAPHNVSSKVGAGLALVFRIQFHPDQNKACKRFIKFLVIC